MAWQVRSFVAACCGRVASAFQRCYWKSPQSQSLVQWLVSLPWRSNLKSRLVQINCAFALVLFLIAVSVPRDPRDYKLSPVPAASVSLAADGDSYRPRASRHADPERAIARRNDAKQKNDDMQETTHVEAKRKQRPRAPSMTADVSPLHFEVDERQPRKCTRNRTLLLLHAGAGLVGFKVNGDKEFLQYCPEMCVVWEHTNSYEYFSRAHVVEYHSAGRVKRAFPQQLLMYFSMESPRHSALSGQMAMGEFNLKRTYHLDSDIFAAYIPIGEKHLAEITKPPPVAFKDRLPEAVATIVSNCAAPNNRLHIIQELQKGIEVHSFGFCMHNKNLPANQASKGNSLEIVRQYKFYLALENSLCRDYVTEKFWRALYHGAVPVVTSFNNTPNYSLFTPNADAYINLEQFASISLLAKYLKKVAHDESLFRHHLRHRYSNDASAVTEEYRRMWGVLKDRRRFCRLARRMLVNPGLEVLSKRRLTADQSCAASGRFRGPVSVT